MSDDTLDLIAQVRREIGERAAEAAAKAMVDERARESWRCRHGEQIGVRSCGLCTTEALRTAKVAP